jgi:hypothetical protein
MLNRHFADSKKIDPQEIGQGLVMRCILFVAAELTTFI